MALSRLEAPTYQPEPSRREALPKPVRLDKVTQGREVFEFLAQKRGITFEELFRRKPQVHGRFGRLMTTTAMEFLEWDEAVLGLTDPEIAHVVKRDESTVRGYKARLKRERQKEKQRIKTLRELDRHIPQDEVTDLFISGDQQAETQSA